MNQNLSPKQFTRIYKPSEYGETWSDVPHDPEFHHVADESNFSHEDMVESLKMTGMQVPVQVYKGHVVDGHHRVVAAIDANVPIKFEHAPSEMYEGQIKR